MEKKVKNFDFVPKTWNSLIINTKDLSNQFIRYMCFLLNYINKLDSIRYLKYFKENKSSYTNRKIIESVNKVCGIIPNLLYYKLYKALSSKQLRELMILRATSNQRTKI